jgi:hypothetical protein
MEGRKGKRGRQGFSARLAQGSPESRRLKGHTVSCRVLLNLHNDFGACRECTVTLGSFEAEARLSSTDCVRRGPLLGLESFKGYASY